MQPGMCERAIEYLYYNHGFSSTATSRQPNAAIKELINKYHPGGWKALCDEHHTNPRPRVLV